MRNWKKIVGRILWSIAGGLLVLLFIISWKAKEEKKCTNIDVELVGENTVALFMDEKDILAFIHEKGIRPGMPIGALNLNELEKSLRSIKWINHAELYLDNHQSLQIKIEQRSPIARVFSASGASFYIDKEGRRLPLKQLTVLRLPVFTGFPSDQEKMSSPDSLLLNDVLHFTKAIQKDSFFMAQIAQINIESNGDFEMVPSLGDHIVLMGAAENVEDKLNRLYSFYKQVWVNSGINAYQVLDCRFDHQIVALKKGMQPIQFSASILANDSLDSIESATIVPATIDSNKKIGPTIKVDTVSKSKAVPALPLTKQPNKGITSNPKSTPKIAAKTAVKIKGKPKAKTTVKKNNKTNNKSLNNKKKSAKAVMPKKAQAKNN